MNRTHPFLIVAAWLSLSPIGAIAAETHSEQTHDSAQEHAKHTLSLFAGVTREHDENHQTLGFEYSYRLNHSWSLGAVIERADRQKESTLAIAFAHWWPYKELFLGAGIGQKDPGDKRENTFRATIGYEFMLGDGWAIAPNLNLDIIENHENEEVFGISIGKNF